ncbi:hypothetical protein [Tabrizicola sp.]|uniref:hypothetical protein n=1 Tax=Tabrizicola sp. TaxID=2005166 RepID=UPI0025EA56BB|nr:hypothetical protein [Tabrizicola sp.]
MKRLRLILSAVWRWYRRRSLFVQALLVVPVLCGILLTALIGNMGLALMGTAVPIYAWLAGWVAGIAVVILGKAGFVVAKDRRRAK